MGSLKVVGDEILVEKRNVEEKKHHRRSRSASDRNGEFPGFEILSFVERKHNLPHDSPISSRTHGSQTSHGQSIDSSTCSSNQRASLEKDIQLLQFRLQQEKSMRTMLEKAIGRTSSTLSPGHRHFASQTKELISEIESLEEEVANREQRVLTLYRSIFEKSVSRPPSEQSSGITSPAHAKTKPRKHPSIISSAFCSSNNFPFRGFSLKSASDNRDSRMIRSSTAIPYKKSSSSVIRVDGKLPFREKTPAARTLKDHLHQCPSKLSEEMVRCMAAVYCWLCGIVSTKPEVIKPSSKPTANLPPQSRSLENHPSKPMIEISSMPADKKRYSQASYAINNYRALVEQLEKVDVSQMEARAQIAFWINVYNSLIMHAYLAYGIPHSSLRRVALFHKAAYNIGGLVISANAIEHSIFCFHTTRVGGWLETILSTAFRKKSAEEKQLISLKLGLPNSQSAVSFALCTGAFSDPVLKVYTAGNVKEELETAKREFLQTNIIVKKSKKLFLPKLLERVAREAGMASDSLVKWVCENVDKKLQNSIQRCIDGNNGKKPSQIIEWLPHCSKFRYAFSQELATKPWWI